MKLFLTIFISMALLTGQLVAQSSYTNYLKAFRSDYTAKHEVVKGKDKQYFRFFAANPAYKVNASFEKISDTTGFTMKTSSGSSKHYYKYGIAKFSLHDTTFQLFIYQSKALLYTSYKDYLFIPFTDLTTGDLSYGSGRYIDLLISDIKDNHVVIDFNKAYNPYCAYSADYHCPIPPKENRLPVAINAGEMTFGKAHH